MQALIRYIPAPYVVALAALVIVPVATIQPLWLSIVAALAALAAFLRTLETGDWPALDGPLVWLLAGIVAWGAASAAWSVDPERSLSQALRLFLFAAGSLFLLKLARGLDARGRGTVEIFLVIGAAIGIGFVIFEILTGGLVHGALRDFETDPVKNLFHLNRASSVISIAVWVAIIPAWRRFGLPGAAVLLLAAAFAILQLQPSSPALAFILGAGVFAVAWVAPGLAVVALLAVLGLFIVSAPFLSALAPWLTDIIRGLGFAEFSLSHRVAIWQFASDQLATHPIIGFGLDASRSIGSGHVVGIKDAPELAARTADALPLHPHSALLQVWLELGLLGTGLVAGLFVLALVATWRRVTGHLERAAAFAMITAAFVNAQLSFGIWQGWWLSCLWLLAIVLVTMTGRGPSASPTENSVSEQAGHG